MHTDTKDTNTNTNTWKRTALLWLPTFAGFPLGGLIAKLTTGHVDAVAPALGGGAISGAVLGLAQWIAIRRSGISPEAWVATTAIGFAAGLGAGAAAVGYHTDLGSLAAQGAVCGAVVGAAQVVVLGRNLGRLALAWPPLLSALWALGWTITSAAGIDVEAQYTVFGSSGALVVTVATSVLPLRLRRTSHG